MASNGIVQLSGELWNSNPEKFQKHIKTYIEEFKTFNPDAFLDVNIHLIIGTKTYDHKVNLCQVVNAIGLCRKCDLVNTIDCTLGIAQKQQKSAAERILELTDGTCELFTSLDETYARFYVGGHLEIHPIQSRKFTEYLAYQIYCEDQKPPSAEAIQNARAVLSAKARFDGTDYTLYNRVAWYKGALYYDLTNPMHQVVKITPDDWEILNSTEIPLFRRFAHQKASPIPERVDNPERVAQRVLDFVNHDQKDKYVRILILVSLIACFIPDIPHAIIIVYGDQGSAKTTFLTIFRRLIDPSDTDTMSFPQSRDLMQTLDHNWFCGFDNISGLKNWLSDALCRAVTGDGTTKRQHYTNDDDFIRKYRRIIALNGINNMATQPDLLDRSVLFKLPRLQGKELRVEKEFMEEFDQEHPKILGAILSILAKAYRLYPTIRPSALFRLADWTIWGCAITQALGFEPDDFLTAYDRTKGDLTKEALANDNVSTALLDFIQSQGGYWKGKMSELLPELTKSAESLHISTTGTDWPKAPNILSRRLAPYVTPLREAGIRFEMMDKKSRLYEIETITDADRPRIGTLASFLTPGPDDAVTIPKSDSASLESTQKTGEAICDDNDAGDDTLQNAPVGIPLTHKESRGITEYENRWTTFLERTAHFAPKHIITLEELDTLYADNERGRMQKDLEDWTSEGRLWINQGKKSRGWRVTERESP